jgi:pimeloyl-ACP methyl ester carboxylesterase
VIGCASHLPRHSRAAPLAILLFLAASPGVLLAAVPAVAWTDSMQLYRGRSVSRWGAGSGQGMVGMLEDMELYLVQHGAAAFSVAHSKPWPADTPPVSRTPSVGTGLGEGGPTVAALSASSAAAGTQTSRSARSRLQSLASAESGAVQEAELSVLGNRPPTGFSLAQDQTYRGALRGYADREAVSTLLPRRGLTASSYFAGFNTGDIPNGTRPVVAIVHGVQKDNFASAQWIEGMADEIRLAHPEADVVTWYWPGGVQPQEFVYDRALASLPHTVTAGEGLAEYLLARGVTSNVHLIGHSMGTHVVGSAAKRLTVRGAIVDQVTLLDRPFGLARVLPAELHQWEVARFQSNLQEVGEVVNYVGQLGTGGLLPQSSNVYNQLIPHADHNGVWQYYTRSVGDISGGFNCSPIAGGVNSVLCPEISAGAGLGPEAYVSTAAGAAVGDQALGGGATVSATAGNVPNVGEAALVAGEGLAPEASAAGAALTGSVARYSWVDLAIPEDAVFLSYEIIRECLIAVNYWAWVL